MTQLMQTTKEHTSTASNTNDLANANNVDMAEAAAVASSTSTSTTITSSDACSTRGRTSITTSVTTTTPTLSYAAVASTQNQGERQNKEQSEKTDDRKRRMFTIYNLASAQPSESIIAKELALAFNKQPHEVIDKIQRDTRYRSRYNILFRNQTDCMTIFNNGVTIAGQRIRGFNEKRDRFHFNATPVTHVYVPNFPAYGTKREITDLFCHLGTMTYARERVNVELGIAIGGWNLGIRNTSGDPIPDTVTFDEDVLDVIYPGKVKRDRRQKEKETTIEKEQEKMQEQQQSSRPLTGKALTDYIHQCNMATVEQVASDLKMTDDEQSNASDHTVEDDGDSSSSVESVISTASGQTKRKKKKWNGKKANKKSIDCNKWVDEVVRTCDEDQGTSNWNANTQSSSNEQPDQPKTPNDT